VQVGVTRLLALVKSLLLLFERNTSHGPSTDHALGKAIGWERGAEPVDRQGSPSLVTRGRHKWQPSRRHQPKAELIQR